MLRRFYLFFLRKAGWKFVGHIPTDIQKFIAVVAPHTSNSDFIIGVAARSVLGLTRTRYLGKSQLFRFPYGFIFKMLGGYPVDRSRHNNMVDAVVEIFKEHEEFSIALAPEGTRSKVNKIKTGFYHIARKAAVPIVLVGFDYGTRSIIFKDPFYPTNDIESDFKMFIDFFAKMQGKVPEKGLTQDVFENMRAKLI